MVQKKKKSGTVCKERGRVVESLLHTGSWEHSLSLLTPKDMGGWQSQGVTGVGQCYRHPHPTNGNDYIF